MPRLSRIGKKTELGNGRLLSGEDDRDATVRPFAFSPSLASDQAADGLGPAGSDKKGGRIAKKGWHQRRAAVPLHRRTDKT
jgi:hypothetical protein